MSNTLIQAVNRKGSEIFTIISTVSANVNLINFTWKTCVNVHSMMLVVAKHFWYICESSKMIASPQLLAVHSCPS